MVGTAGTRVVILGAGPAGLGAAYRLGHRGVGRVTVLERNAHVGGNAGSFELAGVRVDYGSHRLHPACDPAILGDIRALLGDDLLRRRRHGRIRLRGRWIHFPLKPVDLALGVPPSFAVGVTTDLAGKLLRTALPRRRSGDETFASVMEAGLGTTICRDFYFPYARKIWGLEPDELSVTLARRRVSAGSVGKILRKVMTAMPGLGMTDAGNFFYPRYGYGQISEVYASAARAAGVEIHLNARVLAVESRGDRVQGVEYEQDGQTRWLPADQVWSSIPITALARSLKPSPPPELLGPVDRIDYRAMILIYLVLGQERFGEYDAYYFPELTIPITRVSEPKNFSNGQGPSNVTVLCAELPCAPDGPEWGKTDEELGVLVCQALHTAGAPVEAPIRQVVTRRLRYAYPMYRQGYEDSFDPLDRWLGRIEGLLTFGRQGLFSHDNLHHALYMAYCAAACLDDSGCFDHARWQEFRREFEAHVVED